MTRRASVWTGSGSASEQRAVEFAEAGRRTDLLASRLALSPNEAAEALGCSRDFFDAHIKPELRLIRRGRLVLVSVDELRRWLERSGERTLPDRRSSAEARHPEAPHLEAPDLERDGGARRGARGRTR